MKLVVFYSWQSDRDSKLCRNFIEIALTAAAERLKARRGIEVVVDSDTKDVPGTPPISDTILKKIDACDVFLADMTFVAATEERKLSPNPNVMGEYGYALKAKGWPNILLVMNTAFGAPEDLPFDLHHLRHPLGYSVATVKPDAARRAARDRLSEGLELALETIADKRPPPPPPPDLRAPLEARRWETLNARISNNPPTLVSQPQAVLHVIPAAALEGPAIDHRLVQRHRDLLRPAADAEAVEGQDHTQWWAHGPRRRVGDLPNPEAWWCGRLLRPGIVEHVFTLAERMSDDPEILVRGFTLEKQIVSVADRSLELLARLGSRLITTK